LATLGGCGGGDSTSEGGPASTASTTSASGNETSSVRVIDIVNTVVVEHAYPFEAFDCPEDVSIEEGATFTCDFDYQDLQSQGTVTFSVDAVSADTATVSYTSEIDGTVHPDGDGLVVEAP
jgi:hypothetical protein